MGMKYSKIVAPPLFPSFPDWVVGHPRLPDYVKEELDMEVADRLLRAGLDTGPDHQCCVELDNAFADLALLKTATRKAGARVKKLKDTRPQPLWMRNCPFVLTICRAIAWSNGLSVKRSQLVMGTWPTRWTKTGLPWVLFITCLVTWLALLPRRN